MRYSTLRERLLQLVHDLSHLTGGLERVGAWPLEDADRDRRLVIKQAAQRVLIRAQLDPSDVAHAGDLSIGSRAHDDVGELLLAGQPALRVDRQLERGVNRSRRRAEHTRRNLHVLLADRANDIRGRQPA